MKKRIKYKMPLKARAILDIITVISMLVAPVIWIALTVMAGFYGLWQVFIEMPLETRRLIIENYVNKGVAMPIE